MNIYILLEYVEAIRKGNVILECLNQLMVRKEN